jgi:hypothetical protein
MLTRQKRKSEQITLFAAVDWYVTRQGLCRPGGLYRQCFPYRITEGLPVSRQEWPKTRLDEEGLSVIPQKIALNPSLSAAGLRLFSWFACGSRTMS